MTKLDKIGLAFKDEVCNVKGTVNTIDRCSISNENMQQPFGESCKNKNSCQYQIDFIEFAEEGPPVEDIKPAKKKKKKGEP